MAGCQLWLRPDQAGLATGDVDTWADQSGNGRDASGVSFDASRPQKVAGALGGLAVIRFNGPTNSTWFNLPDYMGGLTNSTLCCGLSPLNDPPATGARGGLFAMASILDDNYYPFTDSNVYLAYGTSTRPNFGDPAVSLAAARSLIVTITAAGALSVYLDNAQLGTTQTGLTLGWASQPHIGRSWGSNFFDGDVMDWFQYDSVLSATDRDRAHRYLADRMSGAWLAAMQRPIPTQSQAVKRAAYY